MKKTDTRLPLDVAVSRAWTKLFIANTAELFLIFISFGFQLISFQHLQSNETSESFPYIATAGVMLFGAYLVEKPRQALKKQYKELEKRAAIYYSEFE